VAGQMAADAGLELVGGGTAQVINELPTSTWPSGRLLPRAVSTTGKARRTGGLIGGWTCQMRWQTLRAGIKR